ncbi:hypothetical protein PRIPAC_74875, partial [Pristionchus pacificus]
QDGTVKWIDKQWKEKCMNNEEHLAVPTSQPARRRSMSARFISTIVR